VHKITKWWSFFFGAPFLPKQNGQKLRFLPLAFWLAGTSRLRKAHTGAFLVTPSTEGAPPKQNALDDNLKRSVFCIYK
jgi:hypothetical protein